MLRIALPNPIILIPMQSKFLLSRGLSGLHSRLMLTNAPRSQPWVLLHGLPSPTMERIGFARLACSIGKSGPHERGPRAYHLNEPHWWEWRLCEMGLAICRGRGSALSARWQGLCQLLSQGCDGRQIAITAITLFVTEEEVGQPSGPGK